jgi:hypothetical protein
MDHDYKDCVISATQSNYNQLKVPTQTTITKSNLATERTFWFILCPEEVKNNNPYAMF